MTQKKKNPDFRGFVIARGGFEPDLNKYTKIQCLWALYAKRPILLALQGFYIKQLYESKCSFLIKKQEV